MTTKQITRGSTMIDKAAGDLPTNDLISDLLNQANEVATRHIEKLARKHLRTFPSQKEFIMGMGSAYFTDQDGRQSQAKCIDLEKFLNKWDHDLKLTGTAMRFTSYGKKITDW